MAITTQKNGTSATVIANKMSLIIPVIFAYLFYNDQLPVLKIIGIVIALIGVYLSLKNKGNNRTNGIMWLPVILFFVSGGIDISIKYIQHHSLKESDTEVFVPTLFTIAFLMGVLFLILKGKMNRSIWDINNWLYGIMLGIINYGSIYFLVKALEIKGLQSSVVFPLNNISIVLLSIFFGITIFKEKLSKENKYGILLAIISIILISFSK